MFYALRLKPVGLEKCTKHCQKQVKAAHSESVHPPSQSIASCQRSIWFALLAARKRQYGGAVDVLGDLAGEALVVVDERAAQPRRLVLQPDALVAHGRHPHVVVPLGGLRCEARHRAHRGERAPRGATAEGGLALHAPRLAQLVVRVVRRRARLALEHDGERVQVVD